MQTLKTFSDGYRVLVIGASGGIGKAIVAVLRQDSRCARVDTLSRKDDGFDLVDEATIEELARKFTDIRFDLILCATGALTVDGIGPEKSIKQISPEIMARQFAINAIGPALVLKHFTPLLSKSSRSAFAFLSARVGSIGDNRLGGWVSYRSSKAALNQIVRTASIEIARTHPLAAVVVIHPGTVNTPLSTPYSGNRIRIETASAAQNILSVIDGLTSGKTGRFYAYDGKQIEW